jgi:glycosyltransferase involved in cell wall biosynthesis
MLPIVTIASKNYLAHVRTLAQSYRLFHPEGQIFVCLVDQIDGYFDPATEPFTLIQADRLNIPRWEHFSFKYNILELNTAVKPFLLSYLFEQYGLQKIAYFDPDIMLYQPLDRIESLLDDYGMLLTPHILEAVEGTHAPSEMDLLLSGIYNLGFIALSRKTDLDRLLTWWQTRLYDYCLRDVSRGLFVDQRWMDFAPALFPNVYILRDEGYNVAYWNFVHRPIEKVGDQWTIKGQPVMFMHYSGLEPENHDIVSKHQYWNHLKDLPVGTQTLIQDYKAALEIHDYSTVRHWPYAYGTFANGQPISDLARTICRELDPQGDRWSDPFQTGHDTFYQYLFTVRRANLKLWKRRAITWGRRVAAVMLPPVLGEKHYQQVRQIVFRQPNLKIREPQTLHKSTRLGVNLIGYLRSETGVGEAARGTLRALNTVNYPLAYTNITLNDIARKNDFTIDRFSLQVGAPYPINLLHVNADQIPHVQEELGRNHFKGHYNVGFWFWELSQFPGDWQDRFALLNEIWVASSWVQRTIGAVSPIPVLVMPLCIEPGTHSAYTRDHFGLARDTFVVLFMFDALSAIERKNPFGLIRAFKKALGSVPNAQLVIKASHLESSDCAGELREAVSAVKGILIDRVCSREEVNGLLSLCDMYVSLHRSEGFGLSMAEAMFLGKPVIATGYSANMEFMTSQNSYPVNYELIPIMQNIGPYTTGQMWAEPDEDHAAQLMRQVYNTPDRERSARAAEHIRRNYNAQVVGSALQHRLNAINGFLAQ